MAEWIGVGIIGISMSVNLAGTFSQGNFLMPILLSALAMTYLLSVPEWTFWPDGWRPMAFEGFCQWSDRGVLARQVGLPPIGRRIRMLMSRGQ